MMRGGVFLCVLLLFVGIIRMEEDFPPVFFFFLCVRYHSVLFITNL